MNHPEKGDPMLTVAIVATMVILGKVLLAGVTIAIGSKSFSCGSVDGGTIAAVLTPTLGAFVMRKNNDVNNSTK